MVSIILNAQTLNIGFANPQITSAGPFGSFEVDVIIRTDTAFKLGSGQVYFNYNPLAFGNSTFSNGRAIITSTGAILGQTSGPFGLYTSMVTNDNAPTRLSFSWQQALSSGCFSNNITGVDDILLHLRMDYISGGQAQPHDLCFEFAAPFDDEFFTACGPHSTCALVDCSGFPPTQLVNDIFDCTGSALPVELIDFTATLQDEYVELDWLTATEINTDYFEIQRSTDAHNWTSIGRLGAVGLSTTRQEYRYTDSEAIERYKKGETLYYRLSIVDLDEYKEWSSVEVVQLDASLSQTFSIFPNPTRGQLSVNYLNPNHEQIIIRLYHTSGKMLLEVNESNSGKIDLDLSTSLPSGVYLLEVRSPSDEVLKTERILLMR